MKQSKSKRILNPASLYAIVEDPKPNSDLSWCFELSKDGVLGGCDYPGKPVTFLTALVYSDQLIPYEDAWTRATHLRLKDGTVIAKAEWNTVLLSQLAE